MSFGSLYSSLIAHYSVFSERHFINPVGFITFPSHGFNATLHQEIILKNPGTFSAEITFISSSFKGLIIEKPLHPSLLEGMLHSQKHNSYGVNLLRKIEEFKKPQETQFPVQSLEDFVIIWKGDRKPDWFILPIGKKDTI